MWVQYAQGVQKWYLQNDSDSNVTVDISVYPSIAAIREERVLAAQFEFNHVSMAETELILRSLDPNKATGHDQIPARVLRDEASVLVAPIARLINTVTDNARVPSDWKLAEICPIFKRDVEFYFIKEAKLSNYADDNQLYFADTDPAVVEHVVNKELVVVCEWFCNN